jgi:uncharacterized protein YkwD
MGRTKKLVLVAILGALAMAGAPSLSAYASNATIDWTGPKTGHVLYYAQGVMEEVIQNRTAWGLHIRADVEGYAAVTDCAQLGRVALFSIRGSAPVALQIVDCSAPWDAQRHVQEGNVGEVDFQTAQRFGFLVEGRAQATLLNIVDAPPMNGGQEYILWAVNEARAKEGLSPVAPVQALVDIAQGRSADMARRQYFSHTTPEGTKFFAQLEARAVPYSWAAEILARNDAQTPQAGPLALQSYLDSPAHRAIMLDARYTWAGVGYSLGADGFHYFTVILIEP